MVYVVLIPVTFNGRLTVPPVACILLLRPMGSVTDQSVGFGASIQLRYFVTLCCYTGWVLPSEVFPLSMRSKGVSLSTASNWVNNCTPSTLQL